MFRVYYGLWMSIMIIQSLLWVVNDYHDCSELLWVYGLWMYIMRDLMGRWGVRLYSGCLSRTMLFEKISDTYILIAGLNRVSSITHPQSRFKIQDFFIISFEKLKRGRTLINISNLTHTVYFRTLRTVIIENTKFTY